MNIKQAALIVLVSTLVLGCGGGSKGDSKEKTAHNSLKGDWLSRCIYFPDTGGYITALLGFDTDDGDYIYGEKYTFYDTSDCSGNPTLSFSFSGEVDYRGTQSTSICEAEKYDVFYSLLTVNGRIFEGQDFDDGMDELELPKSTFNIACKHRGNLYSGLLTGSRDATSPNKRPIEMDLDVVLYPASQQKSLSSKTKKESNVDVNLKDIKDKVSQIKTLK